MAAASLSSQLKGLHRHAASIPTANPEAGNEGVFVGTEPGDESLRVKHYYADPSNAFYSHLHRSGFTPRRLLYNEDATLPDYGIGVDDVYYVPDKLRERLELFAPSSVCFNSMRALERFAGVEKVSPSWRGRDAARHVQIANVKIIWALPDSSGRASGITRTACA